MLSLFPELLAYQLLAPFILRVVIGFLLVNLGYLKLSSERPRWTTSFETLKLKPARHWASGVGVVQILGGLLLIVGAFTQLVAMIVSIIAVAELYIESKEPEILKRNIAFYLLVAAICVSLIFSGAGFLAVDLPL